MNQDALLFFARRPEALHLYDAFESRLLTELPETRVQVQKSQISFYNKHLFACVSLRPVQKASRLPSVYMVVTFGLERRAASPRILAATEPYPNRWTHHVVVSTVQEIDEELMGWLHQACLFSANK